MKQHRSSRGFTLVEMSIVVLIVGILATIGFVGYRRYVTHARMMEGTNMVSGIVAAQERYKAEAGVYVHINDPNACWYPRTPGKYVTEWGGPCDCCARPWDTFGLRPSGPVAFGFGSSAGVRAQDPIAAGGGGGGDLGAKPSVAAFFPGGGGDAPDVPPTPLSSGPWFIIAGMADFDGNPVRKTMMIYDSDVKMIATSNDGE